ncbi:hypothetical protein M5040_05945, partial [Neisseria meningitidis]|nr:hypothetical protein [Neisseria meningitidis]
MSFGRNDRFTFRFFTALTGRQHLIQPFFQHKYSNPKSGISTGNRVQTASGGTIPQDAVTINKRRRNYAVRITPPSRRRQRAIITDCPLKKSDPAFVAALDSDFKCNTSVLVVGTDSRIKHLAFRSQVFFLVGGSTHLEPC